jgi:NADH dehydrogenase FAD-containing subunit
MGVRLMTNAKVTRVLNKEVIVDWVGIECKLPADYVVFAAGVVPRNDYHRLEEKIGVPVHYAGNCANIGSGLDAMREGFEKGRTV